MAAEDYFNSARAQARGAEFGFVAGMYVTVNKGRDARGRFTKYKHAQVTQNRNDARTLQNYTAALVKTSLKRPRVSTGRLQRVTADERNARVLESEGFYVGNYEFLDRSQAKYWRTIEFGTAEVWTKPWIGMKLPGSWGATIAGWGTNKWGKVPLAGPKFTRAGTGSGGKFRPLGGRARQRALNADNTPEVRQHIAPMRAYREAWQTFGGEGTLRRRHVQNLTKYLLED